MRDEGRRRTSRTPSHYIDGLCMLPQCRQVANFAFTAAAFDLPHLLAESALMYGNRVMLPALKYTYAHIAVTAGSR